MLAGGPYNQVEGNYKFKYNPLEFKFQVSNENFILIVAMKKWCSERIPPTDPDRKFKLDETFKSMINKAHTSRRGKKYKIFRNQFNENEKN